MIRHHHNSRPKSQPPIKLSEMVGSGAATNKRQHQHHKIDQTLGKLRSEEEQHWMEKYEKSRSLRFSNARMSTRNLKTLCESQTEDDCNTNVTGSFACLNILDLVSSETSISPLTSSSGSSSSSSGGSSLASSTLSLSSVSSASTVMNVEAQKKTKLDSYDKIVQPKPYEPLESRKDSLASDEESSSNSSSCSSSSGISSICKATKEISNKVAGPNQSGSESLVDDRQLERAVAESLEALVSSVAASQASQLAPLAFDVLMVKMVPFGEESSDLPNATNTNSINQRSIINKCRRHIFNALTHAQKVGRREAGWRVELQLSTNEVAAQIKWFKEVREIEADESDSGTATIISADHVLDCLVEHELVIWLVSPKSERCAGNSCGLLTTTLLKSINGNQGSGHQVKQSDAKLAARGEPSGGSESSSPVCGNLIGITTDCEPDQMFQSKEFQHVESIIWLCSNELDAEQVQEAWREFSERKQAIAREELVSIGSDEEVAQMDAIKSINSPDSFPIHANGAESQESIAVCTDEAPIGYVEVVGNSQLNDGGGGHLDDDDKAEQYNENRDHSNQLDKTHRDVLEADSSEYDKEASSRQQATDEPTLVSYRVPRDLTNSYASGPMANNGLATSVSTRLRRTVSVFNLAFRYDNHSKNHSEHLEPTPLGSCANSASSQFLTACGADLAGKQGDASLTRHSVSSKIIKSLGQEIQRQNRLVSPSNQIDGQQQQQQQQRKTFLKVGSTCDLSSSGQQLAGGRRLVSTNFAATKRMDDHPQQLKASNASANNVSTSASMAPVVKPRMSILKRQVAAGSCLLSSTGSTKGYQQQQQQSGAKAAPSQMVVASGKSAVGNQDEEKCDSKRNIDRNRPGNSHRQRSCLENGSSQPAAAASRSTKSLTATAAASIDKLNDPFECDDQSGGVRRYAVTSIDNCAQVVAVSSSSPPSVVKMSSKVAADDEQAAPGEISPRGAHRSVGDVSSKLDNQPGRLPTSATKIGAPSRHQIQQQRQHSRQPTGKSIEACDELQSSRQSAAMATSSSRLLDKVLSKTPAADAGSRRQQQHEAEINQTTKTRRKAVHSLANCELLARHHHSQQLSVPKAGVDVTIKVNARHSRGNDKSEAGNERDCGRFGQETSVRDARETNNNINHNDDNENNEVDFVASGSAAREQAFERLRQRASCYDITRLMSKNSIIQSQLARLKATGPSRSDSLSGSSNELRQRKPAELLMPNAGESSQEGKLNSECDADLGSEREVSARIKSQTNGKRESVLIAGGSEAQDAAQRTKARATIKSKVPVGGVAVLRHEEPREVQVEADCDQDEPDDVASCDGQSERDVDDVRGNQDHQEEEDQESKRSDPSPKPAAATGLSKFNLLRQSFNQKTISSMLKFSSRASLRIKTSKPQESANTAAATQEQQVTQAASVSTKQLAAKSSKTSETVDQQQQKQIAALDSATLMLYNRHMQQRQQQKIVQQQQQQYALQWQQHQIYIQQQQQQQQQQRQQLAFMANHYVASHQHQMLSGIQLAPSLATIGSFSTATSSMYAQQLMMMQQQQKSQHVQSIPKATGSNVVGNILRKSILKSSSSKAKEELAVSRQMALGSGQAAAHHYAHVPSQIQQPHGPMVPFEVNHHSSVNIVYGAESRAPSTPDYGLGGGNPYQLNEYLDQLRQQRYAGTIAEVKETAPGASSLKASMRKRVKSILINRTGDDQKAGKKLDGSQARQTLLQQPKPLKSALKSTLRRSESTLNLNSDGSDGDQSNSSTLESSSSSSGRSNETPVQLKSALKKPSKGSLDTGEKKLISILSNVDDSSTSSNSSDNSFKRAISARCSRRLTIKSSPRESTSEARVSMKPIKKNVTFSSKLTSIQ